MKDTRHVQIAQLSTNYTEPTTGANGFVTQCGSTPMARVWTPIQSVPMAAECEWGNLEDVFDDFPKLIVVRAIVRVIVCDGDLRGGPDEAWLTPEDIVAKLTEWIGTFECTQIGDTYFLVTYQWNHNESLDWNEDSRFYLRYFKIVGNGPGQPPICEELSPE